MSGNGLVILVGAGPGDPGLLTLKGRDALSRADVVVYDNLIPYEILDYATPGAERIYVGKVAGRHTLPQEDINRLLVERARHGHVVVRLKGGDPFVFGRGGEECAWLRENNVRFEIVPGVSAASAVPAYAGIPVTSRNLATSFHVITGHEHADKANASVDWSAIARLDGTLVIFMGVTAIRSIAETLIEHGRDPAQPAAAIRWGGTPHQQTLVATLADIADQIEATGLRPPATIVIGEVVRLRDSMRWFEENAPALVQHVDLTGERV